MPIDQTVTAVLAGCISGSIGDTVFSHNQHGPYTRPRTTPAYPGSPLQLQMAQAMSFASIRWEATNQPLRDLWDAYARDSPLRGPCGNLRTVTGREMYFRAGLVHWYNKTFNSPAPGPPRHAGFPGFKPVRILRVGVASYDVHFDDTEPWVTAAKGFMQVQFTNTPTSQFPNSINFFKGPYGGRITIDADPFTPPTSPFLYFGARINAGFHRYARVRLLDAEGRLSNPQVLKVFA